MKRFLISAFAQSLSIMAGGFILALALMAVPSTSLCADSTPSHQLTRIRDYLGSMSTIRVFLHNAPNQGHQTSTISLMKQLRKLGFNGNFEVVSSDEIKEKLEFLIPGFDVKKPESIDTGDLGHINFFYSRIEEKGYDLIHIEPNDPRLSMTVPLAITGGNDEVAKFLALKAEAYLQLQPLNWRSFQFFSFQGERRELSSLLGLPMPMEVPSEGDILDFIQGEDPVEPRLKGVKDFLSLGDTIEILPVYGQHTTPWPDDTFVRVVKVLRAASKIDPSFWKRPIVIPVLGKNLASEKMAKEQNVRLIDASDPLLKETIQQLKPGEPLLVNVGFVQPEIFAMIYSRITTFGVLEGKNTATLARQLGKPFINLKGSNADYELLGNDGRNRFDVKGMEPVEEVLEAFGFQSNYVDQDPSILYDFLKLLKDPNSAVSKMFKDFKRQAEETNKVIIALSMLLDVVHSKSPQTPFINTSPQTCNVLFGL